MKKLATPLITATKYLLILLVIYGVVNWYRSPVMPDAPTLRYQQHAKQIDVMDSSHQTPVLLYFWGTWCSVCRLTTPNVQALHEQGHQVVTVAVSDDPNTLHEYLLDKQLDFIVIDDRDGEIFRQWQGKVTPSFVIIKDGKVHQSFTGIAPLWLLKARLQLAGLF